MVVWDESVLEKSESLPLEGLGPVRSSKAARLKRIKPGYFHPPGRRPIFVPGWHWLSLILLGMDGWEVCRRLHQSSSVPVIMLTAKSEELDKLRGFRLGVDDYVTKPFSFAEMVARIGAVPSQVRDATEIRQQRISGDLGIDFDQHRVTLAGQVVELTSTEHRLFEVLARHANSTVPTEE